MENTVFMSIKEIHMNRILNKTKNHEFRNIIPKNKVEYIIVYIPTPIKEIKYILQVDKQVCVPNIISTNGIGNEEFNLGIKSRYAYPIKHVFELNQGIRLEELKSKYKFTAPQSFAYGEKYTELLKYIEETESKKIY